jgi:hypothetical protein
MVWWQPPEEDLVETVDARARKLGSLDLWGLGGRYAAPRLFFQDSRSGGIAWPPDLAKSVPG